MKHYYAARHTHGTEFSYDSGWAVYVFSSKADRDEFVYKVNKYGYDSSCEAVSRDIARKIAGSNVKEELLASGFVMLVQNMGYKTNYWS